MHKISKKNHYERLSVPRDASSSLIAKAYREIAAVYHPDSGLYAEDNGQKLSDSHLEIFKLITESYNVLRDEDRRRAYDKSLPKDYKDDTWTDLSKSTSAQNNAQKNTRKSGKDIKTNMDLSKLNKTVAQGFRQKEEEVVKTNPSVSILDSFKNYFLKK